MAELKLRRERVQSNMALADGEDQFRAVAGMFGKLKIQEKLLQAEVDGLEQSAAQVRHVDEEVGAALAVLDRWTEAAAVAQDPAKIGELFRELNVRLFLRFSEGSFGRRVVNKLGGGVVTFGETPPPVPLYDGPTGRCQIKSPPFREGNDGLNSNPLPNVIDPSEEGAKTTLGNVSRGDRRWTFPNEVRGGRLVSVVFAQTYEFTADTFFDRAGYAVP